MTSPMYIAEISPPRIRRTNGLAQPVRHHLRHAGRILVNYFMAGLGDPAWNAAQGWRWMFGSGVLPAGVLLVLLLFVPESPRMACGQRAEERGGVSILTRVNGEAIAVRTAGDRTLTREQPGLGIHHRSDEAGHAQGVVDRRRGAGRPAAGDRHQRLSVLRPRDLQSHRRFRQRWALLETIVVGSVNLAFTVLAVWTVDRVGRKPLMLIGFAGMGLSLTAHRHPPPSPGEAAVGAAVHPDVHRELRPVGRTGDVGGFSPSFSDAQIRGRAMAIATLLLWVANYVHLADVSHAQRETAPRGMVPSRLSPSGCTPLCVEWPFCLSRNRCPKRARQSLEEVERLWTSDDQPPVAPAAEIHA